MPTNVDKYFTYVHLPSRLQAISQPIAALARLMDTVLPDSAEKNVGMRKLLEAKDCFVRAALPNVEEPSDEELEEGLTVFKKNPDGTWSKLSEYLD